MKILYWAWVIRRKGTDSGQRLFGVRILILSLSLSSFLRVSCLPYKQWLLIIGSGEGVRFCLARGDLCFLSLSCLSLVVSCVLGCLCTESGRVWFCFVCPYATGVCLDADIIHQLEFVCCWSFIWMLMMLSISVIVHILDLLLLDFYGLLLYLDFQCCYIYLLNLLLLLMITSIFYHWILWDSAIYWIPWDASAAPVADYLNWPLICCHSTFWISSTSGFQCCCI